LNATGNILISSKCQGAVGEELKHLQNNNNDVGSQNSVFLTHMNHLILPSYSKCLRGRYSGD